VGEGWSWTEIWSHYFISSNPTTKNGVAGGACRAESDLASDDNYAQATIATGSGDNFAIVCRMSAPADSEYVGRFRTVGGWRVALDKRITGVTTTLGRSRNPRRGERRLPGRGRGTTLRAKVNGVTVYSLTDSSIATGQRFGIVCQTGDADFGGANPLVRTDGTDVLACTLAAAVDTD
jgi:hypothetical protein